MKKVLFASTALVMVAGVAAADVSLSGSANMGLKYNGTTTTVHNEIDFDLKGSASTDGGLTLGASVDLDASHDNSATTAGTVTDPEVYISYEGLTLTIGDIGEAHDQGGLKDVGYDGIGIDNIAEIAAGGSHDVRVDYSFGDIAVAASVDSLSTNNDWAIGMSTSFDSISVAVGFGEFGGANQSTATIGFSSGAISANVFYADSGAATGQGIDVSYTSGDVTVTAVYAESGGTSGYGIGFAYDLGGATLAAGFGDNGTNSVADLGVSFSF